jgi:Ca-activated chloride channel family protein
VAIAWLPGGLQFVGLTLLVLAFAAPGVTHRNVVVRSDGLDIVLAIDTSGSMEADDYATGQRSVTRLEVAKGVVADFIEDRPHDRIGVVVFGEEAFTHVPLTLDHTTLLRVLDQVDIGVAGARGTAIGSAVAVSAKQLKDLESEEKLVILLTDGQSNAGRLKPIEAARAAGAVGVKVYTVGVGSGARRSVFGQLLGGGGGLDEVTLQAIADETDGQFFKASDARTLSEIYDTIDELEPSPAEVEETVEREEWYRRALLPGTLLLILLLILQSTLLRRWP